MIVKDWARTAADEICDEVYETSGPGTGISSDQMVAIIDKHDPFKQGVAYMPVPRCDGCKLWKRHQLASTLGVAQTGDCFVNRRAASIGATREDFGCVQWEAK